MNHHMVADKTASNFNGITKFFKIAAAANFAALFIGLGGELMINEDAFMLATILPAILTIGLGLMRGQDEVMSGEPPISMLASGALITGGALAATVAVLYGADISAAVPSFAEPSLNTINFQI